VNILHLSEQLEAARAENSPEKATEIIKKYLDAWGYKFPHGNEAKKLAATYFQYPQTALKTLEQYSF
jgi:TorA maturation chaperone TorD